MSDRKKIKLASATIIIGLLGALVWIPGKLFPGASAQTITTFYVNGTQSELSSIQNGGVVTPQTGPAGTVVVGGTGSVNFDASGTGVSFKQGGQQQNNTAFYKFTGSSIDTIFNVDGGEINFDIKSSYSNAERAALPQYNYRVAFGSVDASNQSFSGWSVDAGGISWNAGGGTGKYYAFPAGQGDVLFGKGVVMHIRMTWDGSTESLYINDQLVQQAAYAKPVMNWGTGSLLTIGSATSYGGGFYSCDDVLSNFVVTSGYVPPADTVPPVISAVQSSGVTQTAATITWTTDEGSDSQIEYGLTTSYGNSTSLNTSAVTAHSVAISGLAESTFYHYRVKSRDAAGNLAVSADQTFTTSASPQSTPTPPVTSAPVGNGIVISDMSGGGQQNKPFTISRFFKKGEIANYPIARIAGAATLTQADVISHWDDGSVKQAMVSFLATIPAGGSIAVDFANQQNCNCGSGQALSKDQMLGSDYNFNATMQLSGGDITAPSTVDARAMLNDAASISSDVNATGVRYWLSGPIATQVILEDRSPALKYDVTTNYVNSPATVKSFNFHPIFIATFYLSTKQVKVEYIGENSATNYRADETYDLALTMQGQQVYSKAGFKHTTETRWRKTFWINGGGSAYSNQPSNVRVDYNLPYMVSTGVLPNFDTSRQIPSQIIKDAFDGQPDVTQCTTPSWNSIETNPTYQWLADIGGYGQWCQDMGAPGGRPDLGPVPGWYARYLYTMSSSDPNAPRLWQQFIGNAEASGKMGIHWRENLYTNRLASKNMNVNAFGHFITLDERPSITDQTPTDAAGADSIGWGVREGYRWGEVAHLIDIAYIPYLITGDYYFMEEQQAAASWVLVHRSVFDGYQFRNPNLAGVIYDSEFRGEAWGMRTLGEAAFISPDNTPEKDYFTNRTNINIAVRMGKYGITGGSLYNPTCTSSPLDRKTEKNPWCYGYNFPVRATEGSSVANLKPDQNPMVFPYAEGPVSPTDPIMDSSQASKAASTWMSWYNLIVYGRLAEMGFDAQPLLAGTGQELIKMAAGPGTDPKMVGAYYMPVQDENGIFFQTAADLKNAFRAGYLSTLTLDTNDTEHGYVTIARAAMSYLNGVQTVDGGTPVNGQDAWNLLNNLPGSSNFNADPHWDFLPRVAGVSTPAPTVSAPVIATFTAVPSSIASGGSSTLSWNASNATSLSIDQSVGSVTGLASKLVSPAQTTTYTLTATNSSGSVTKTATVTVTAPLPSVSNLVGSNTTASSTTISWNTNVATDGQVFYGTTTAYGLSSPVLDSQTKTTVHSTVLTNLASSTLYHFKITSTDALANSTSTPDFSFTTAGLPVVSNPNATSTPGNSGGPISNPVIPTSSPVTIFIPQIGTTTPVSIPSPQYGNNQSNQNSTASSQISSAHIKLINQAGTLYIIFNGQRRGITNPGMLYSYGLSFRDAHTATAEERALPEGGLILPNNGALVKAKEDQTVYLISQGQRHAFTAAKIFTGLGFKFSSVLTVTNPELQALPLAPDFINDTAKAHLPGVNISINKTVYWVGPDYTLHPYPSLTVFNSWNLSADINNVLPANGADKQLPVGNAESQRIK